MSDDDLKHRLQQNEWGANPSPDFEETSPTPSSLSSRKRASDSTMSNIPDLTTKKSKGNGSVRARKRRKGSVCKSRAQRQVEAKQKRAQGLYTTVHGSQICGYVCLSEGNKKRYGRPCSQFATSGSQYCKSHAKFDTEWKEELDQVNAKSTEPIDYTKKYCVCNDTYQDGDFMIACDVCNDWFHGECIGITEEKGESMESFVCNLCRGFNF